MIRRQGGSYTNLFNSGSTQHQQHPFKVGFQANAHSNHIGETGLSHVTQSKNTFEHPAKKVGFCSIQNGGSLRRPKTSSVKEENEDTELFLQMDAGPYAINSPGINRRINTPNGLGIQSASASLERALPPKTPSTLPRVNSPHHLVSVPSQHGERVLGRPPHSPHSPSPARGNTQTTGMSLVHSASPIKDRMKYFYPSRSRENLHGSRGCVNRSDIQSPERGDPTGQKCSDSCEKVSLSSSHDQHDGRFYRMAEISRNDGGSPRDVPPSSCRARSRIGSKDYVNRSGKGDNWSGSPAGVRQSGRDRLYREGNSSRYGAEDASDLCLLPRRSSESHSTGSSSKESHCPRDRDRSRSFDFDKSPGKPEPKQREKAGSGDYSIPRNLSEPLQPGSEDNNHIGSSTYQPQHEAQTVSGYHQTCSTGVAVFSRPAGMLMVSSGNSPLTSTFMCSSNPHHSIHAQNKLPSLSPSILSSHRTSRPPTASTTQQQRQSPPTFMPALPGGDSLKMRDKRIGERLGRQNQLPHKERSNNIYDTYEASV